jgi:Arf-GAP/coiled-coil/ANK repeat/PH domain-containing protein
MSAETDVSPFISNPFLCRGANSHATDRDGRSALQYAMDRSTSDEDMLMLLEEHFR